jgi:hypothetical protein
VTGRSAGITPSIHSARRLGRSGARGSGREISNMIRLIGWNLHGRDPLGDLHGRGVDVALLQEVCLPSPGSALQVMPADETTWWTEAGKSTAANSAQR